MFVRCRAGYKVTVIDSSDPDWWKGKCLGKIGFFPSKYVAKLAPNEKPLQVTHNLQINENDGGFKLLRDQVRSPVSNTFSFCLKLTFTPINLIFVADCDTSVRRTDRRHGDRPER